MAYICDICGKGKQFGHNVSFSHHKTAKVFHPNLHNRRLSVDGRTLRVKLCSSCLKKVKQSQATSAAA